VKGATLAAGVVGGAGVAGGATGTLGLVGAFGTVEAGLAWLRATAPEDPEPLVHPGRTNAARRRERPGRRSRIGTPKITR
jgi:hypothetical protein